MDVAEGPFDLLRLVTLGEGLHQDDRVALVVLRPELFVELVLVVLDDGVGQAEDFLGRPVVLLKAHDRRLGVVALERQDVADVGPAKGVDALGVVAHDAEVLVAGRQHLGEAILGVVGVLVLVDMQIGPALLVRLEDLRLFLEEADGVEEEVVEVHRVGPPQGPLVRPVEPGGAFLEGRLGQLGILGRPHHLVLGT